MKPSLLLLGALVACPQSKPPQPASKPSSQVLSFDYAWQRVHDTYHDPNMGGVDWEAVREELRPEAEKATDNDSLRPILQDMLSRLDRRLALLEESHRPDARHVQMLSRTLSALREQNPGDERLANFTFRLAMLGGSR